MGLCCKLHLCRQQTKAEASPCSLHSIRPTTRKQASCCTWCGVCGATSACEARVTQLKRSALQQRTHPSFCSSPALPVAHTGQVRPTIVALALALRSLPPRLNPASSTLLQASSRTAVVARCGVSAHPTPAVSTHSSTSLHTTRSSSSSSSSFSKLFFLHRGRQPNSATAVRTQARSRSVSVIAAASATGGKMSQPGGPRRLVLWFRNDLRLHDNPMVSSALQKLKAKEVDDVVPVYCLDARFFKATSWGNLKTGAHRAKFLLESAQDLKQSLKALGSDLLVTVGLPEEVIAGVAQGSSSCSVLTTQEVTSEETAVDAKVARAIKPWSGQVVKVWGSTLFHLEDAAASMGPGGIRTMPDVFTPFKDKVEKRCQVRKEVPAPKAGELPLPKSVSDAAGAPIIPASAVYAGPSAAPFDLAARLAAFPQWGELPWPKGAVPTQPAHDARGVMPFKGGETAALARLKHYLWDSDCIASYFDTRNGMLGPDYSTKLAPWLSAGCISPRTIYHQIKKYEAQRVSNKSTYWVIFELIWRDFFRFFALKHGNKIFFEGGTSDTPLMWSSDPELWQRWRDGKTGLPLVDANMRELAATGWMSNRGRQNVASYLVLDLGVDWRRGADYFESALLDYDVCSNWGNWVAMAGLTGGRVNHFNIAKQSKDYDPDGEYIRHWIPELKNVPTSRIHEPWLMGKDEMVKYGVQIGSDYPSPIPASKHARPHGGGGGGSRFGGGGGGGRGSGGYSGGGRGSASGGRPSSGRPAPGRHRQAKMSEFERFG